MAKSAERYICIHGHFYQPPRENPWLGQIETQPSAAPFHDWNARINFECYRPNASARVVDSANRILDIRNTYESISFNFGPTLFSWIEERAPEVYAAILEADRRSVRAREGHGNAIAQVYNHIIMPLAERRDRLTQILWGLEDFRRRFGRDPEGMWLPETAVDTESLVLLAENGIKFTILAPHQAAKFRASASASATADKTWKDCAQAGGIDPTRAYACPLPGGRSISLFFYDGPVSRAIAFDDLLADGSRLARRLTEVFRDDRSWPQLVHAATDGETFGHHHRFGEMALVYALHLIESQGLARLTNFGQYLERHPPAVEVQIAENTSWSCAHGVERWRSNCGCAIHPDSGWNQKWRAPLRDALNLLKRRLDLLFEELAAPLAIDPWKARDDYIHVILGRANGATDKFLHLHARPPLTDERAADLLHLLEMQHYGMLMFTSCGWFFDELSGIEPTQNLLYAARALQLAGQFRAGLEEEFLAVLGQAPSNVYPGGGREIWARFIQPEVADLRRVIANAAIARLQNPAEGKFPYFSYEIEVRDRSAEAIGSMTLALSRIRVRSRIERSSADCIAAVLHFGAHDFHCALRSPLEPAAYARLRRELFETFRRQSVAEVLRLMDREFDARRYTIRDLFPEERLHLLERVTTESFGRFLSLVELIHDETCKLMDYAREMKSPVPKGFLAAAELVLRARIERAFELFLETGSHVLLDDLVAQARRWEIAPASGSLMRRLQQALDERVRRLSTHPDDETADALLAILAVVTSLGIENEIDLWEAQNTCFELVYSSASPAGSAEQAHQSASAQSAAPLPPMPGALGPRALILLATRLRVSLDSPLRKTSITRPPTVARTHPPVPEPHITAI